MTSTPQPDGRVAISAVILTYYRQDLLGACLGSLRTSLQLIEEPTEVIVVDNGSEGNVATATIAQLCPEARVVTLPMNRGYPGGLNAGLEVARGEWILCIGDDATTEPDAVRTMLAAGRGAPDIGSVAARMVFADTSGDSAIINSTGMEIDRLGVAYDRLLGAPAEVGEHAPVDVFGTCGGGALYRSAMLTDTGGFDSSFHMYLEDADLAWRARARGWRCIYARGAVVHHLHSATTKHRSDGKYFYVGRNRVRMLAKNAVTKQLMRYGPLMVLYDLGYVMYALVVDRSTAPLRGRVRGLREWRAYRGRNAPRVPVDLAPIRGVRAALRRNAAWMHGSGG